MDHISRPVIEDIKEDLVPLIEERRGGALQTILLDLHPADIAEFVNILSDDDDQKYIFELMREAGLGSAILVELPSAVRDRLIEDLPSPELADLVEDMSSDDAADLVQDLPEGRAQEVLQDVEAAEAEAFKPLLHYGEETAGGIMASEILAVDRNQTVADAAALVRSHGEELEPFFFVYVLDADQRLLGVLSLKDLVLHDPRTNAYDACDREPVTVPVDMDQEAVANIVRRYDLLAVPVVDSSGRLLGRITIDDVVDVMREEADEDLARMVGTDEEEFSETSVRRIALFRLPWILASLGGGMVSGLLLNHFAAVLAMALSLIAFVPVITAMGGNSGSQAAITMVRLLALRRLSRRQVASIVWREARVGMLLGFLSGGILALVALLWKGSWFYGVAVGVAMASAILVAVTMGALIPVLFKRLKVDPAIATGPFVSASNDATGLLIYFGVAILLLRFTGGTP